MDQTPIAIVGGGPAGMNAAIAAAELGAKVTLIDGYAQPGGQYYQQMSGLVGQPESRRRQKGQAYLQRLNRLDIKILNHTRIWDIDENFNLAWERSGKFGRLKADALILATGAYDRPAAFPGWTLPGVIGVGAAHSLVKTQRVLPGRKILIAGTGPLLLALGALLLDAGADVAAVLEGSRLFSHFNPRHLAMLRGQGERLKEGWGYLQTIRKGDVRLRRGWGIIRAIGGDQVEGALIGRLDEQWRPIPGSEHVVPCDTICIGYGFLPETSLSRLTGAQHVYRPAQGGWIPWRDEWMQTTLPGLYAAGDGAGIGGAALSEVEGRISGTAAALSVMGRPFDQAKWHEQLNKTRKELKREQGFADLVGELFLPGPGIDELADDSTIVCRCEEVKLSAVRQAVQMGAQTVDSVKGLTRAGMGLCQGRMCGRILAGQVARYCGRAVEEAGMFSVRPPVQPLYVGEVVSEQ